LICTPSVSNIAFEETTMNSCLFSIMMAVALGADPPLPAPAPLPAAPAAAEPAKTSLVPACPLPVNLCDFCRSFKPAPGQYEVLFLHPVKCCPIWVCFTLPPGCPKVCCDKRNIVFDYGCNGTVVIHFKLLCGGVKVRNY